MTYWYDDIERVLDDLSKGNIDSTVAIELLTDLGYSRQVVIEDILCGHDE